MIEIKFPCPRCGQKIACDETASGTTVHCPACQAELTVPDAHKWLAIQALDVFMIYRGGSGGGEHLARLVREGLKQRRFEVFADDEEQPGDKPDITSLKKIELATDVIVICTLGAFDRCENADDRVRVEIRHAIRNGKNIVPIFDRHFAAPSKPLPDDIAEVLNFNGLTPVHNLWEESMNRLATDFLASKTRALATQSRLVLAKAKPLATFAGVVAGLGILCGLCCLPKMNLLAQYAQLRNLLVVTKMTLGFEFGLSLLMIVGAVLAHRLKKSGVKLISSTASALVLSNTACSLVYILLIRTNNLTGMSIAGPPVLILMVTIIPLVLIIRRANQLLR